MFVQKVRNVCQALTGTLSYLEGNGVTQQSRAGEVLASTEPVCTVTHKPYERVLFSPIRDANPYFHMMEAMWMLAGRRDGEFMTPYIKDFMKLYAEDDGDLHGAYGHRWRYAFGFDQLDAVARRLIEKPNDRQSVIAMWDPHTPYGNDLNGDWKDRPCNTHIYVRRIDEALDLTVCCRSNDMIWGAHGSNAVHFSILQEYLAARIDCGIGKLYQISNNAHVYLNVYQPLREKAAPARTGSQPDQLLDDRYVDNDVQTKPMFHEPEFIDDDIHKFLDFNNDHLDFYNEWFLLTATPMKLAHRAFKMKQHATALNFAHDIEAPDWRLACTEWILRRMK
jgi:thymidylate synthase